MVTVATDQVPGTGVAPLIRRHPIGGSRLVQDYLHEVPSALRFFPGSPHRLSTYRLKLAEVDALFGPDERAAAARTLRPTSDLARERLDRFVREGGVAVTTGQQTGFLTGPLYTIHKAISAAALARHLERRLGRVVLPIFWSASEDHDWAEVNHAYLLDPRGRPRRFGLSSADPRPLPMSRRKIEGDAKTLAEEIRRYVGQGIEHDPLGRTIVDAFSEPGRTVAEAFNEAMAAILAPFGMVLADAADPALKELSRTTLLRALEDSERHESILRARTRSITEAGYDAQVTVLEGATNVFRETERGRERLYRVERGYGVRERRGTLAPDLIRAELDKTPEVYSPNVLLRPVIESSVLPTLAYVGGPGELAYFAQVGALFEAFGRMPPVAMPRYSGLVIEPAVERSLDRLHLSVSDLDRPRERLVERLAGRAMPESTVRSLTTLRKELTQQLDELADGVEDIDPTLVGALGAERDRLLLAVSRVERKVVRALKRSDRVDVARLDRVLDSIRPMGQPQDRVLNILPYLARYGAHFLEEARVAIDETWPLPDDE